MCFKIQDKHIILFVFVKPNASKTALVGVVNGELHIALHAKPQEGEANNELIRYLSKLLGMPKTQFRLLRGEKSRHKQLSLPLMDKARGILADLMCL